MCAYKHLKRRFELPLSVWIDPHRLVVQLIWLNWSFKQTASAVCQTTKPAVGGCLKHDQDAYGVCHSLPGTLWCDFVVVPRHTEVRSHTTALLFGCGFYAEACPLVLHRSKHRTGCRIHATGRTQLRSTHSPAAQFTSRTRVA
jgi:hypothetical protein